MRRTNRIMMATLIGIAMSGVSQAALVVEWNFDDLSLTNSGSSGVDHSGVTSGTPVFTVDTPTGSGYALDLSGAAGYMWVTNSATNHTGYVDTFDAPSSFSYSMWVKSPTGSWNKWDELAGKGYQDEVVNSGEANSVGWTMRSQYGTDGTMVSFYRPNTTVTVQDTNPSINLLDQLWHLLTYTYDSATSTLTLYVDGVEEASATGAVMLEAIGQVLIFDARENPLGRQADFLYDNIQFYDHALSSSEVVDLYIPQADVFVDSDEISLNLYSPETMITGSVSVSYLADTNVEVAVSISDESHPGAFTLLNTTPLTLVDPSPSNTVLEFAFDNAVTGLQDGESATGFVTIAWNVTGDAEVTEIILPISVLYELPAAGPILWDFGKSSDGGNVPATVADFVAAGVMEYIGDGAVSNVEGAQNMLHGGISVDLSNYAGSHIPGATYTGAGAALMKEYIYHKGYSDITIGGLSSQLEASTEYSLYVWGKGDADDQQAIFSFDGIEITTATNDVFTSDATNFMAKFSFTTDETVADTLTIGWNKVAAYTGCSGFAIVPLNYTNPNPEVGDVSFEIVSDGTEIVLRFETSYGALYSVEATGNLVNGPWTNVVMDVAGTDSKIIVTNALLGDSGFYRAYIQD
ncbi:hypothetical protein P4C99_17345 [Pontiellaceae bacterium B1224]|nr:hypothetical protein [Pontiellaceae bacterium B1224]